MAPEEEEKDEGFSPVDFIMRLEGGEIDDPDEVIDGFQRLIDSGVVWNLQGSYGRTAARLIESGKCKPRFSKGAH
jgi:hypothetical protein